MVGCGCWSWLIGGFLVVFAALWFLSDRIPTFKVAGKNCIVTGGSSGIGLSTAKALIKEGAGSVAICARTQSVLDAAKKELETLAKSVNASAPTKVYAYSVDVSDEKEMTTAVNDFVAKNGTLDAVIASAGVTNPDYFSNLPVSEFERIMRINYLGCVVTVKAAVPHMKKQATGGRFVLVSSMAGLAGIHGYSAYAPSKYAVRGLAECLAMEFKPYKIYFSVSNPPDVDTPMYAKETATKPEECKLISAGTGVFKPEQLAADILAGLKNYKFFIQTGFDGFMLGIGVAGFNPMPDPLTGLLEILLASPMRIVAIVTRWSYDRIVAQVHAKSTKNK